jgi:dCMP deaminase
MTETKPQKYLKLAIYNAELFSKDKHTKVGTILLSHDFSRILSTGVNGFPRKVNDLDPKRWERPTKYDWIIHSEMNAICNAARSGVALDNSVAVVTLFPCKDCAKGLIQAGISKIYAPTPDFSNIQWGKDFEISCEMFEEAGIEIEKIDL